MITDGTRRDVVDVPVHSLKYIKEKFEEIRMDDKGTVKKRESHQNSLMKADVMFNKPDWRQTNRKG